MKWLTTLFKPSDEIVKPKSSKVVLDYSELYTIALGNTRYLRALINTKRANLVYLGKREAKKYEYVVDGLEQKLAEEEFYVAYYNTKRIRQKSRLQHSTV
jgi:hypothetical protein